MKINISITIEQLIYIKKVLDKPIIERRVKEFYYWKINDCNINIIEKDNFYILSLEGKRYGEILKKLNMDEKDTYKYHIGGDEAGKGEDIGPLVICLVELNPQNYENIESLNIKDSKLLTNEQIKDKAIRALKILKPNEYIIKTISPEIINTNRANNINLNKVMIFSYRMAIKDMIKQNHNNNYIIDAFVTQETFDKEGIFENKNIKLIQKGESISLSVATASIISRYQYQELMSKVSQNLNYNLKIGAHFENNIKPLIYFLKEDLSLSNEEAINKLKKMIKNNLAKAIKYINDHWD